MEENNKEKFEVRDSRDKDRLILRPLWLKGTPFAWQDVRIMKMIRLNYSGKKRTTAIAIYQTLTELASLEGRGQGKHVNCFKAYLETIAERSGKSVTTIKRYSKEFKKLGIISWENQKKGKMNLSNLWKLHAYSLNKSTSTQNKEPNPLGQNNEPLVEEDVRNYITKKDDFKKSNGLTSLKDIFEDKKS